MSASQLSWFVDDTVSRALQGAGGVAQVSRVGGVDREINVIVDPDRMAAQGLTATGLNAALFAFSTDIPGGRVDVGGREQTVRVLGEAQTVSSLRNLTIPTEGGRYVKLSDVADVGDGSGEPRGFARLNDRPVVGFQVLKTTDASEVTTEDNVKKAIVKLQQQHPDVGFTEVFSTVDNTRATFEATLRTMLEGMALAALVVFLFLRDWRSTAIVAIAMPVSLIPTFLAMAILGFSLNVVTLLALTLVIGILVDDAIVEIENIQKRVQAGARPYRASMEGADQIGLAVIATTLAIVVVFAPVSFMGSIPGQFFKEFGFTVVDRRVVLAAGRAAAHAAACGLFPEAHGDAASAWAICGRSIGAAWTGPSRTAGSWPESAPRAWRRCSGVMVFGLPTGVQPPGNPDYMFIGLQGPPGATLADMQRIESETTALLKARVPEASEIFAQVGSVAGEGFGGGGAGAGLSSGTVTVVLKADRLRSVSQIEDAIRPYLLDIPDARVTIQGGGFGAAAVQKVLTSDDDVALNRAGEELEREMRTLRSLADPRPVQSPIGPEIAIRPKPDQASRLGVTVESIATIARVATLGDIDANVPKLDDVERRVPIRVRLPVDARTNIDAIRATAGADRFRRRPRHFPASPTSISRPDRRISSDTTAATSSPSTPT